MGHRDRGCESEKRGHGHGTFSRLCSFSKYIYRYHLQGLEMFRAQLFALTLVEPDRQKIMLKGKLIKVARRCSFA